jgi:hypothetical protein
VCEDEDVGEDVDVDEGVDEEIRQLVASLEPLVNSI